MFGFTDAVASAAGPLIGQAMVVGGAGSGSGQA